MPMLLGAKGKDILQWRASAELLAQVKSSLARQWDRTSSSDAEALLGDFIGSLEGELEYEAQFQRELAALNAAIDEAPSIEKLQPMLARYHDVISAHFRRRESVLAACSICNALHDRLVAKSVSLAAQRMLELGQGTPPLHALVVCGARARGERTLFSEDRYLLLHEEESSNAFLFSRQLSTILREVGLIKTEQLFWHGPLSQWHPLLNGEMPLTEAGERGKDLPEWEWRLEAMTDLLPVEGDQALAARVLDLAAKTVLEERNRGSFLQLARRVISMPLATGRFGRWRLQRDGEHRGEMDLEELGLSPLVMAVRILAVQMGTPAGGTVPRIQGLLERGELDVELSGRLLRAYQCLMQHKILSEIRNEAAGAFCTPDELDSAEEDRLRVSLEAILNLQKIAYQKMAGMG
jgi:CBS domain-containing protein